MDNSGDNAAMDAAWLPMLTALQDEFAATIDRLDPSTPVPSCGSWTAADLVEHLTEIHHWAAAMARREGTEDRIGDGGLRTRYEAGAADLRVTLARLEPDAPARTLIDGGTVVFWHRRQLHETLVHLWDLRTAAGLEMTVDPRLWADTVDEAVTVMHPRQLRLGRAAAASVRRRLVATDVARSWTLPVAENAARLGTANQVAATVTGPALALALLVWGRIDLGDERLRVEGDPAAFQALLADHFLP